MNFNKHIAHAKKSKFGLFKLNLALGFMVPFNKPHKIKIKEIQDDMVKSIIPYRRKNFNHIKGIHACGMATAAEFSCGFHLLSKLGIENYRLIMESIEMTYLYQAKLNVYAIFKADENWIQENIIQPLQTTEKINVVCEVKLVDEESNHVATGKINWQIKDWKKVKTKL